MHYTICMFAIQCEVFHVVHENLFRPSVLGAEECVKNLHAKCNVNNEAKIFRTEIVFATLKPAVKIETVECNLH